MTRIITSEQFRRLQSLVPEYFTSTFFMQAFFKLFCVDRAEDTKILVDEFIREVISQKQSIN